MATKQYSSRAYARRVIARDCSGYSWEPGEAVPLARHGISSVVVGEPCRTMRANARLQRAAATLRLATRWR